MAMRAETKYLKETSLENQVPVFVVQKVHDFRDVLKGLF